MRRLFLASLLVSFLASPSYSQLTGGGAPDRLEHFRLVPRLSTLTQTGGFAGVDTDYRLIGEYDFLRLWNEDGAPFGGGFTARFDNAEIWGSQISDGPVIAIVLDVDELLNLEGLRGELLPLGAPFDVYRFSGLINDGFPTITPVITQSSIELFAARVGPWMFLKGSTTPPPGSADFFEYEIRAVARRGPWADLNDDGVVDAGDYTLWRNGQAADLGVSYLDWRAQFGETEPDMAAFDAAIASFAAVTAVPEPTTLWLVLSIGCGLIARRRYCSIGQRNGQ